jgi:sulfur carrier protein ThiS
MPATIELHAFMGLADVFRERQWTNPTDFPLDRETTGAELMAKLDIPMERVEVIFINRKAIAADDAVIQPGDRVALVPPGVPGPHRFLLGFKNRKIKAV